NLLRTVSSKKTLLLVTKVPFLSSFALFLSAFSPPPQKEVHTVV
ncbi:membrane-associated protein, putative, partial [Bodo saltans]